MASAGGVPAESGALSAGRSRVPHPAASEVTEMDNNDDEGEGESGDEESFVEEVKDLRGDSDDDDDNIDDNMTDSGVSRVPTEIVSVCTAISITGMDPVVTEKV